MVTQVYQAGGYGTVGLAPFTISSPRNPASTDILNTDGTPYQIGYQWLNTTTQALFIYEGGGTWVQISTSAGNVETLTGDSGGAISPTAGNITLAGGTGIATAGSGSTITFNAVGGGLKTTDVSGTSQALTVNARFVANNAGLVTMTLPATAAEGDTIEIVGKGAGGWQIAQNASQAINCSSQTTTTGTGGSLSSVNHSDSVRLTCTTAGASTIWNATAANATLQFV